MARRARKNGRFTKSKRRTSRKTKFNVGKAAETALVANAAIGAIFGTTLPTFITGRSMGGTGFGENGNNNSWELTIPELFNGLMGGNAGMASGYTIQKAIRHNLKSNGPSAIGQMVLIPLAFRFGRKLLAKPLINPTNRMLKSAGLGEVKL